MSFVESAAMKRQYVGDSYDAVKRQWHVVLSTWAPLTPIQNSSQRNSTDLPDTEVSRVMQDA